MAEATRILSQIQSTSAHWMYPRFGIHHVPQEKMSNLLEEISDLRRRIDERAKELQKEEHTGLELKKQVAELKDEVQELRTKEELQVLLSRVAPEAHQELLLPESTLLPRFEAGKEPSAFVMSVDIRRSTELMLKAQKPAEFALFITELCHELTEIVMKSFGVFDKFTGDGILAFFPEFFTGEDAGFLAIRAADECHAAFERYYKKYRSSFKSVLLDVGLGIGIDYGTVQLVYMAGGLTVVGAPVVYACRMGSAPPGKTLLNQPAYERINEKYSSHCFLQERTLEIKHEGRTLAYQVKLNDRPFKVTNPGWLAKIAVKPSKEED